MVANEIKDLAKQTAAATGDIKQKIDSIPQAYSRYARDNPRRVKNRFRMGTIGLRAYLTSGQPGIAKWSSGTVPAPLPEWNVRHP